MDDSRIEGMDHLLAQLDRLTLVQGKQILAKSLRRGPLVIAEEAEHRAPRRTGKLAGNIINTVQEQTATEAISRVGPSQSAFYGLFPEFGTAHMMPEPFLEPAFDAKVDEAIAVIGHDLAMHLEAAIEVNNAND